MFNVNRVSAPQGLGDDDWRTLFQLFGQPTRDLDDFNVALIDSSGEYRSFAREGDTPRVETHDPLQAHFDMLRKYTDADMHNLTAYLVTLK